MKIIYLDIDWVLIRFWNTAQIRKTRAYKWDRGQLITSLDQDLVENLIKIVNITGAYIVISSSWRRHDVLMQKLKEQFIEYGKKWGVNLIGKVIWETPYALGYGRGNEILTWLTEYHKTCSELLFVTHWVAIDDDNFDMKCVKRLGCFVHTKTHEGLTEEKSREAIKILSN